MKDMTPTLRSSARSATSGIACSPSSKFVSMLSNIFDTSALNYDIIRNSQCNLAASLSFGRQTTILFPFMLICSLCAYYTKHLAFRPLQTPLVFQCLDFVSHITLNCPLFRLDHLLPQLLPLRGEPIFLRGRARRIWLRHLDKAEFD